MCNLSQGVWEGGIKEGKKIGRKEGFSQGISQGITQGITQGIAQGMLEGTIQHVKSLMEELPNLDVYKAMDLLKVEEELREEVIKALQE
ncbi:MAG: hypothetical protein U0N20_05370 [Clostridium sp.]